MHIVLFGPKSGERFQAEIKTDTEDRLIGTCFRGTDKKLAGNFCRWNEARGFLDDPEAQTLLAAWIERAVNDQEHEQKDKFDARACLPFSTPVGWGSTIRKPLVGDTLEERAFPQNPTVIAEWIPWDADILAPATNLVTIDCRFRTRKRLGCWEVELRTVYPGPDIGRLRPTTVTQGHDYYISRVREIAFFQWTHRGEPISPS